MVEGATMTKAKLLTTRCRVHWCLRKAWNRYPQGEMSISQATLHGQLKDFNLEISHSFSTIDNDTLDGIVRSIKEEFPNNGYRMVWGHLKEGDWLFSSPVLKKGYYELTLRVLYLHGFTSQIEKIQSSQSNHSLAYWRTSQTHKVCFPKL